MLHCIARLEDFRRASTNDTLEVMLGDHLWLLKHKDLMLRSSEISSLVFDDDTTGSLMVCLTGREQPCIFSASSDSLNALADILQQAHLVHLISKESGCIVFGIDEPVGRDEFVGATGTIFDAFSRITRGYADLASKNSGFLRMGL